MIINDIEQLRKLGELWCATNDFERIALEIELEKEHFGPLYIYTIRDNIMTPVWFVLNSYLTGVGFENAREFPRI